MFINSNNLNGVRNIPEANNGAVLVSASNGQKNAAAAPPTFSTILQSQAIKTNGSAKEPTTKLITPNMLTNRTNTTNNNNNNVGDKKQLPEPLTKNQMLQALKYLIENDDEFTKKVHDAYLKSLKN